MSSEAYTYIIRLLAGNPEEAVATIEDFADPLDEFTDMLDDCIHWMRQTAVFDKLSNGSQSALTSAADTMAAATKSVNTDRRAWFFDSQEMQATRTRFQEVPRELNDL